MQWLFNSSMCNLLYHALLQPNSTNWIGVVEVVTGADNSNIMVSPVVGFVLEKFSFVLAWVIVELQELTGKHYSFGHMVLDSHCVHCVAEFKRKIRHFLYDILNGTNNFLPPAT
ncbi:hypothetical protein EDC04DRAFT_2603175 [Pisolithus marmoratus]|nr:hypothetical protein EDC04DRAFT_2603175 [Pisolithus marmoratus]